MRRWYRKNIAVLRIDNPFDLRQYDAKSAAVIAAIRLYKKLTRTILQAKASLSSAGK
jgi:hypothetical protein